MKNQIKKMNKKAKVGIIAAATTVVAVIAILVLLLTGIINFKLGSLSTEEYKIVGVDFVSMTQKGTHTYDLNVTLEEKYAKENNVKLYMSKNDTFNIEKSDELKYDKLEDGTYQINGITYNAGDYFLYVEVGGESGVYPLTIPKMNPKTWMNGKIVNIEFEVDGNTSWSSFIDPTGKNVYRSGSKIFDSNAKAMEENIDILTSSFSDPNATKDEPYYYIVFNGKNGKFKYISAPLFYTATQGDVETKFYEEKGKPYLDISGNLFAVSEDAERVMQLRVGNYKGDDPTSTFMVDNSYKGKDKTAFTFKVPLEKLKESSNNLVVFLEENGTMCEWSINAGNLDLSKYTFSSNTTQYGLTDENALKITRMLDAYDSINAKIEKTSKGAILKVAGQHKYGVGGKDYQLILTATDGQQYMTENLINDGKKFSFEFELEKLYSSGVWYDIQVKCVNEIAYYDIASTAANMEDAVTVGEKKYNFEEYGGLLKIQYSIVKDFGGLTAKLTSSNGKPLLSVSGTIKGTKADNLTLALRTGDTVYTSVNTQKEDGKFSAILDLNQIKEKETWHDVLIYYKDANQYYDLSISNADMTHKLEYGKNLYTFQEWEGQLKVNCSDTPVKISKTKAVIEQEGNKVYLIVTGVADEDASTYKLGLRNEGNFAATASNIAKGKNFKFKINLEVLPKAGAWYDIIVGHRGFGDSKDLTTSAADMKQTITLGKKVYSFQEWEDTLKITYLKIAEDLKGVNAKITTENGKPVLKVTGTMKNASSMYLGIRTDDVIQKVANKGSGNKLSFTFDLTKLKKSGTWYDVIIGNVDFSSYKDITVKSANMDENVIYKSKDYRFAEWNNQLKVYFKDDSATGLKKGQKINDVTAVLILKDGKPYLRVHGTMDGIKNENLQLGIRNEDKTSKVSNITKSSGRFLFDYELTKLAKHGIWYDIVLIENETDAHIDLKVKAVYNMEMSITHGENIYMFADYEGDLKIYYRNTAKEEAEKAKIAENFSNVKAEIQSVNNKPILKISGSIGNLKNKDVTVNVRSGDAIITAKNTATKDGQFSATVDLTKLKNKAIWYDVYWKVDSADVEINLTSKQADMDSNYKYGGYKYQFKEWNSQLKVEFE